MEEEVWQPKGCFLDGSPIPPKKKKIFGSMPGLYIVIDWCPSLNKKNISHSLEDLHIVLLRDQWSSVRLQSDTYWK